MFSVNVPFAEGKTMAFLTLTAGSAAVQPVQQVCWRIWTMKERPPSRPVTSVTTVTIYCVSDLESHEALMGFSIFQTILQRWHMVLHLHIIKNGASS